MLATDDATPPLPVIFVKVNAPEDTILMETKVWKYTQVFPAGLVKEELETIAPFPAPTDPWFITTPTPVNAAISDSFWVTRRSKAAIANVFVDISKAFCAMSTPFCAIAKVLVVTRASISVKHVSISVRF